MSKELLLCFVTCVVEVIAEGSHFSRTVLASSFVDKTLLIKQVFRNKISLITAPTGFGKSTNMDMIKTFLELQDGNTNNCDMFKVHNLNIYRKTKFFQKHCGRYPVIVLDFKSVVGPNLNTFKSVLQKTFAHHRYLLNSVKLDEKDKTEFTCFLRNSLTQATAGQGLLLLSRLLHAHFNKTMFVLIDNLDNPVFTDIFNPNSDILKTLVFLKEITSNLFVNNSYIKGGLINSRIQLPLDPVIKHFPYLGRHRFADFYGFTCAEIRNLVKKFQISDKFHEIKEWYNGYKVLALDIRIYNPRSVVSYLKNGILKSYWPYSDGIEHLHDLILYKTLNQKIAKLLKHQKIYINSTEKNTTKNIQNLKKFANFPVVCIRIDNEDIENSFIMFLYENGYFNIAESENSTYLLELPNLEIRNELSIKFYSLPFYINKCNFDFEQIRIFLRALNTLYINRFTFRNFLRSVTDLYFKHNVTLPETEHQFRKTALAFVRDFKDFRVSEDVDHNIIINRSDGTIIVLYLKYNDSAYKALLHVLNSDHNKTFNNIYIGLCLYKTRTASISYLFNTTDINETVNMTSRV